MLARRLLIASAPFLTLWPRPTLAQPGSGVIGEDVPLEEFESPGIATLDRQELQGVNPPSEEARRKAQEAIDGTPSGPHPIDIAQSFVDRYGSSDPDRISQWPRVASWNPLVVEFFHATSLRVNNDMVDWCAAFVNWCLMRNHKPTTNNAGSQSFVNDGVFAETKTPKKGDIAVFTCYDNVSHHTLGIGHVGFFKQDLGGEKILLLAGNQGGDRSSIISEKPYSLKAFPTTRHIDGKKVACTFEFNSYRSVP